METFEAVLSQRRGGKHKIYSIHEPEVQCISKGKEHRKYEFGNKASFIRSATGILLEAVSFRNEYDGHTIEPAQSGRVADGKENKESRWRQGLSRKD